MEFLASGHLERSDACSAPKAGPQKPILLATCPTGQGASSDHASGCRWESCTRIVTSTVRVTSWNVFPWF